MEVIALGRQSGHAFVTDRDPGSVGGFVKFGAKPHRTSNAAWHGEHSTGWIMAQIGYS
jgi:hypothetical protein